MIKIILSTITTLCLFSCNQSNTIEADTSTWNKTNNIISKNDFYEKYSFLEENDTIWCDKTPVILITDSELYSHFLSKNQLNIEQVLYICKKAKDGRVYANNLLRFFTHKSPDYKGGYEYAGMIDNEMYYYETEKSCKYYNVAKSKNDSVTSNNPYHFPITLEKHK